MKPTILREAEYRRTIWDLTADKGVDPKMLLQPAFWAHVAGRLKIGDRIEVMAFDGSWLSELIVRSKPIGRATEATVIPLNFYDLNAIDAETKAAVVGVEYEYAWKGPTLKHCVVRLADRTIVAEKFDTKDQALDWIKNPAPQAQAA